MSDTQAESDLTFDTAEQSLSLLEEKLSAFLAAWEGIDLPPDLHDFLPADGELRRLILVELIKVDLEYRWQVHELPKDLAEYVAEFPELADAGIPADLVYEDFHIRRQTEQPVEAVAYIEQFPDQETELAGVLGLEDRYQSTAIYKNTGKDQLELIGPGQTIDDFELLVKLGAGAFAHVYLARQTSMQRLVAVKISADQGAEHQTLAQLDHDYIVRVYDFRPIPDRGLRLLYMQYIAGGTLQETVKVLRETPFEERTGKLILDGVDRGLDNRGESPPTDSPMRKELASFAWPEAVCWLGSRLALALDYAHRRGVLHRDIKPANVLVTADGVPKLADFNISYSSEVVGVTAAEYFGGSLAYMSPEQMEASHPGLERQPGSLDGRSDIYSLGVMLWELLTSRRPFVDKKEQGGWGNTLNAMLERRRSGPNDEAFATIPENCPPGIVRVLARCLEFDEDRRWQTGKELADQLELCRHPRAQRILAPSETARAVKMRPWMLVLVMVAVMLPNITAGLFNFEYNNRKIIDNLSPQSQQAFMRIQEIINAIAYPIGFFAVWWRYRKSQKTLDESSEADAESRAHARAITLGLGRFAALISVTLWTLAGIAYPVSIHLAAGTLPGTAYVQFFASLLLCGLIAAAYPFFLATHLAFRVLYPWRLRDVEELKSDIPVLRKIRVRLKFYFLLAAIAPLLGVLMSIGLTFGNTGAQKMALWVFAAVGIAGVAFLWSVHSRLDDDFEAVIHAAEALR